MVYLSLLEPLLQSYSSEVTNNKALDIISNNIDWAYIFFWFFSFYGQLYETLKPNRRYFKGGENGWPFSGNITLQELIIAIHSVGITITIQIAYYYKKGDNPGLSL